MTSNQLDRELKELWTSGGDKQPSPELEDALLQIGSLPAPPSLKEKLLAIPDDTEAWWKKLLKHFGLREIAIAAPAFALLMLALMLPTSSRTPVNQPAAVQQMAQAERAQLLSEIAEDFQSDSFEIFDDELLFLEEVL